MLAFCCLRNEIQRLPHWLDHYRSLGVAHFLIVDNASHDGSTEMLAGQPDVSLWSTDHAYRSARFGMDWLSWLLLRYGHGHWCLTVDADELLIYPHHDSHDLRKLVTQLEAMGVPAMGALMVDLYPRASLGTPMDGGQSPLDYLGWFDAGPYETQIQQPRRNRWTRGGVRARVFFSDRPHRAPTLNKLPLVRWNRRFAYTNSTHAALPPRLNDAWDGPGDPRLSGILLHTKFLPDAIARGREDISRRQHFADPDAFRPYYDALASAPCLWHSRSRQLGDWRDFVSAGLMGTGDWH
ncbi:glycosyltransferase family 2 protein (plasmid) [Paracoccus sp. TK19116]|uniref:Glycosyltransferase family 2 protein n=1 Tax=Paracoccus albicereus TaxID=2922394 RepID=A0ABT1MM51_9RHOB|nr:glycosyltransferase family 2 protein [Paracoccus albicereus]MCQ0969251.1 glycosyltransferase family 2 protein [Paracoccus albicereus]